MGQVTDMSQDSWSVWHRAVTSYGAPQISEFRRLLPSSVGNNAQLAWGGERFMPKALWCLNLNWKYEYELFCPYAAISFLNTGKLVPRT